MEKNKVVELAKRKSSINQEYDNVIGTALQCLPQKLPTKRAVLKRWR